MSVGSPVKLHHRDDTGGVTGLGLGCENLWMVASQRRYWRCDRVRVRLGKSGVWVGVKVSLGLGLH